MYLDEVLDADVEYPIIGLKDGQEYKFCFLKDIMYCKSEGSYTKICFENGNQIINAKNLKYWESILPDSLFIRVHHSYVINLLYVLSFNSGESHKLFMKNGDEICVSRRRKFFLMSKFLKL